MIARSLVVLSLIVAGCAYHPRTLPSPASPEPVQPAPEGEPGLQAGFGRADITPPPGVGLFGFGPEGRRARGYRHRLYARALMLQDAAGERIAFVVADLGVISPLLHRLVAARVVQQARIGADRLILSATHTHAGPSHFLSAKLLNENGSSVAGFDSVMVEFLAQRIASALSEAAADLRRARAAWAMVPVWGFTRNRSYDAFMLNTPQPSLPSPPPGMQLDERHRAVDPTWTMLRVDLLDPDDGIYRPAGALSIFAIHGTANPSVNDLFDGDIQAPVQRGLERHIDGLNNISGGFRAHAVHLFANGTVGDVSPVWPEISRCPPPKLRRGRRPGGPRRPPAPEEWQPAPPERIALCLIAARDFIDSTGDSLTAHAIAIFDSLGSRLRGDLRIARAFRTLRLRGASAPDALCEPRVGSATLIGADDGYTRFHKWRLLGFIPVGLEQGGSAIDTEARGCHREKRVAFGFLGLAGVIIGKHGLPEVAQLTVVRVGEMLIAAVPAEMTVGAGAEVKDSMRHAGEAVGITADSIAIIGLANGDLRYITTSDEYKAQRYEGASTLYGPESAAVLAKEFGRLMTELATSQDTQAVVPIDPIVAYPGKHQSIFPDSASGPAVDRISRAITSVSCSDDTVVIRWIDAYPGRLVPADSPVLRIERETLSGWAPELWDDDPHLEVRAIRPRGDRGYLWEARWTARRAAGKYRVVLTTRKGLPEIEGSAFASCQSRSDH